MTCQSSMYGGRRRRTHSHKHRTKKVKHHKGTRKGMRRKTARREYMK
jgi:hypothetical protein